MWKSENAGLGKMTTVGGACLLLHVFLCMCGCIYPGLHADMTLSIHRLNWKSEWKQTKPVCVPGFIGYLICGAMSKVSTKPPLPCGSATRLPVRATAFLAWWNQWRRQCPVSPALGPALGNRECTQANIQLSGVQSHEKALWWLMSDRTPESPGIVTERPDRKSEQIHTVPGTYTSTGSIIQPTVKPDTLKETHTL